MQEASSDLRKRTFGKVSQSLKKPFVRCYAPGDSCKQEPIRAHSVQNASLLEALQEDGHVYAPRLQLTFREPKLDFALIGRNHATTFHGLCNEHDTEIFRPIETTPLDTENQEHLFLLSYRAVLKETHATAKSAVDTQSGYAAGVEEGLFPDQPCAPGMLAVEHMVLAYATHMHKLRYDQILIENEHDALRHFVYDLKAPPTMAACALLSTGRYCDATDSLSYATINIFPYRDTTIMVASSLKEHERDLRRTFLKFFRTGNIRECASYLVLKRCDNFVIRPSAFRALSEQSQDECRRFFARNIGPMSYEPNHRNLVNVFGR